MPSSNGSPLFRNGLILGQVETDPVLRETVTTIRAAASASDEAVATEKAIRTLVGAAPGDVVGPASAVNGDLALYDGTTGKLLKDSGYSPSSFLASADTSVTKQGNTFNGSYQLMMTTAGGKIPALDGSLITNLPSGLGDVVGPALATDGNIPLYDGTTGKLIKNSSYAPASFLASGDTSVTKQGNTFNGNSQLIQTTASGKYPALDGSLITGIAGSGDVVGPAVAVDGNIPLYDGTTGKLIKGSAFSPTAFLAAGDPSVTKQGNSFNGVSQLVQTNGSGKLPALDGSLLTGIIAGTGDVAGPSSATDGNLPLYDGTTGKRIKNSVYTPSSFLASSDLTITKQSNTFNGVSQLVQTTAAGKYPALDGSLITGIVAGTGDVVGPALATNGGIALYDGTTGKLIKDSAYSPASFLSSADSSVTKQGNIFNGISQLVQTNSSGKLPALDGSLLTGIVAGTGDVAGPAGSTDGYLPLYDGTTGKRIKDSTYSPSSFLAAADLTVTKQGNTFNGNSQLVQTTAEGKYPALDGSLITGIVAGTGDVAGPASATDGYLPLFDGTTGKLIKNSAYDPATLVVGPASATDGNIALFNTGTGKLVKDAGYALVDVLRSDSRTIGPAGSTAKHVCTGTADQTTFAAAVAAMTAGDTLYVLPGTYYFTSYLTVNKQLTMIGAGPSSLIQSSTNSSLLRLMSSGIVLTGLSLNLGASSWKTGIDIQSTYITVSRCSLAHGTSTDTVGINLYSAQETRIESCVITSGFTSCIDFSNSTSRVTVSGCNLNGITCVNFSGSVQNGGFVIDNNYIWGTNGIRQTVLGGQAVNGLIISRNFIRSTQKGIELNNAVSLASPASAKNVVITSNTFAAGDCRAGCIILAGTSNININANTFGAPGADKPFIAIGPSTATAPVNCVNTIIVDNAGDASTLSWAIKEADASQSYSWLSNNKITPGSVGYAQLLGTGSLDADARLVASVAGPASATDGNIPLYDGTTGKLIKNSIYSPASFLAAADLTVTKQGNTFNGVSQLVQTTAEGKLPALDGSLLTGIVAGTGDVAGPASATDGYFPLYDGTTGKRIKNSAYSPSSFQSSLSNAAGADEALLSGSTLAGLTAGANITLTEAAGVITIVSTGGSGAGDAVAFDITWTHELGSTLSACFLKPVARVGSTYALASADTAANVETVGVIKAIVDSTALTIQQLGKLSAPAHGYTGPVCFVPAAAGFPTETAPSLTGQYRKPILRILDADNVEVIDATAVIVGTLYTSYPRIFTNTDLVAGKLTLAHGLHIQYGFVVVTDDSNIVVYPDDVTYTDIDNLEIDLTSLGAITGSWRALYIAYDQNTYTRTFVDADLDAGAVKYIDITHNLNSAYVMPLLVNNDGEMAMPDYFTFTSDNVLRIDLTTLAPITGTWRAMVRR